jgi:hypothetical protein
VAQLEFLSLAAVMEDGVSTSRIGSRVGSWRVSMTQIIGLASKEMSLSGQLSFTKAPEVLVLGLQNPLVMSTDVLQ